MTRIDFYYAEMVELVDTTDLKSVAHYGRGGSSPPFGTNADVAQLGWSRTLISSRLGVQVPSSVQNKIYSVVALVGRKVRAVNPTSLTPP